MTYSCIKIKIKTDNKNKIITINRSIKTTLEGVISTMKTGALVKNKQNKNKKPQSIKVSQRIRTLKN